MICMDIHAHMTMQEVIGLIGGLWDSANRVLQATVAIPCKSMSTDIQCEMDPISEMMAREELSSMGLHVVGWYHSHPTFVPDPSIRDIQNQTTYQSLFRS